MSTTYAHCKKCGCVLQAICDREDGLCSILHADAEEDRSCYARWAQWVRAGGMAAIIPNGPYGMPERLIAIDQWLELGTPRA